MTKTLIQNMENIEDICICFGERQDVYADRVIYIMAVAIYHIFDWIRKHERLL